MGGNKPQSSFNQEQNKYASIKLISQQSLFAAAAPRSVHASNKVMISHHKLAAVARPVRTGVKMSSTDSYIDDGSPSVCENYDSPGDMDFGYSDDIWDQLPSDCSPDALDYQETAV